MPARRRRARPNLVATALKNAITDERGCWLLGAHPVARNEYRLRNRARSSSIDRYIEDAHRTNWVADYKLREHEGAGVEALVVSLWSLAVFGLFLFTGACWLPVVAIQELLRREAMRAISIASLPARFHFWFRWWFALGVPAFAAVLALYWLMVAKPLAVG